MLCATALIALMLLAYVPTTVEDLGAEEESSFSSTDWENHERPGWADGHQPQLWQPTAAGSLWGLDFSPSGERIAAVDITNRNLMVWNVSDGRVILHAPHANSLVDVAWLGEDVVLAADSGTGWTAFDIVDDGSAWPANGTTMRSGEWSAGMSGSKNGWLWGLDVSSDGSTVAFCGDIDDPNIGGEFVFADATHFMQGGPANAATVYTDRWGADCALDADGDHGVVLSRFYDPGLQDFNDKVIGYDRVGNSLSLAYDRHVAGSPNMAWAVDIAPSDAHYTIGYNRASGGVVANYEISSGNVDWYAPNPQDVSSLEWAPNGAMVVAGLHDPGKVLTIDPAGGLLGDQGWHARVWSGKGTPANVTAVSFDGAGTRIASAGVDGGIEIYDVDHSNLALNIARRLGTDLVREIASHPTEPLLLFAESSGVGTVRNAITGKIDRQCFHPNFGMPANNVPYAKSAVLSETQTLLGFSDGLILSCDETGKELWHWDVETDHEMEVFGRVALHPMGRWAAVTWTENASNTGVAGRVAILDLDTLSISRYFDYQTEYWPLTFSPTGSRLASAAQNGDVRVWDTGAPDAANWIDDGVVHSHANYTGVLGWHPGMDMLLSVGWDRQAMLWDVDQDQQMMQLAVGGEAFSAVFAESTNLVIGSADAGTSSNGRIEFIDAMNMTVTSVWPMDGVPRGMAIVPSVGLVVANHTGAWVVLTPDSDGDGVADDADAFPNNPLQWADSDGDGAGDNNALGAGGDGCPTVWGDSFQDRNGCPDSDGDGWSDADQGWLACVSGAGYGDAFPNNPEQHCDADGDGFGDAYSYHLSGEGLRVGEAGDAFPQNPSQWADRDGDGCGDNHTYDEGSDGLRVLESGDAFPEDATQCFDTDGDGYGDNYTWRLAGDGMRLEAGDAFWLDPLAWSDLDGDGCPLASSTGLEIDRHPEDPTRCDAPLDFEIPEDMALAVGTIEANWELMVDWKNVPDATVRIALFIAPSEDGLDPSHDLFNAQAPTVLLPIQEWTSFAETGVHQTFEQPHGDDLDHMSARLVLWSSDGQTASVWANGTWDVSTVDPDPGPDPNPEPEPGPDPNPNPGPDGEGGDENPVDESGSSSAVLFAGIGVLLLAALGGGLLLMRRGGGNAMSAAGHMPPASMPTTIHAPCEVCGGAAHETVHNGDRWTWCPSCRRWINYLGKA